MAPFIQYFYATSFCQEKSSENSPIMPNEVEEQLTRDQTPFLYTDPSNSHVDTLSSGIHIRGQQWPWQNLHFVLIGPFMC